MNIESYNYTVVATVLGMLVVFLALTGLSLLMVALKAVFAERAAGKAASAAAPGAAGKAGKAEASPRGAGEAKAAAQGAGTRRTDVEMERQAPTWLTAAVAAYLAGGESGGPSAQPWLPEFNHYDPWLAPGRSTKPHGPGASVR
ncbi:MAG: OadG family protein [Spirochaetales bacterium]|nr:OadG family protein [Spirochaetales bacterium]